MTVKVYRSAVTTVTQPAVRVYESTLTAASVAETVRVRVYESTLATPVEPTVEAGLDRLNVEPGEQVTFTATSPDSPDSYTWRQVSGPASVFTQDGASVTVETPYTVDGATVVMGVTCTKGGVTSLEDTVQIGAMRATDFIATDQGWTPVKILTLV